MPVETPAGLRPLALDLDHVLSLLDRSLFHPLFAISLLSLSLLPPTSTPLHLPPWLHARLCLTLAHPASSTDRAPHLAIPLATLWASAVLLFHFSRLCSHLFGRSRRKLPRDWDRDIVVVTGGSGGLGWHVSQLLFERRAKVVILDLVRPPSLCDDPSQSPFFYECDVSSLSAVQKAQERIVDEIGHPTVLMNNAGIFSGKLLLDLSESDIEKVVAVNLQAHFYTIKTFLPDMIAQERGDVVTVSSVMGHVGVAQMTDYVATKHALIGLHESLRFELDSKYQTPDIRTHLVLPSFMQTPLFSGVSYGLLARFALRPLSPHAVALEIVRSLESGRGGTLALPRAVGLAWALRGLPGWLRAFVQRISGADEALGPSGTDGPRLRVLREMQK